MGLYSGGEGGGGEGEGGGGGREGKRLYVGFCIWDINWFTYLGAYIGGRFNGILRYILRIISNTDTDNIKIQMIIRSPVLQITRSLLARLNS